MGTSKLRSKYGASCMCVKIRFEQIRHFSFFFEEKTYFDENGT